MSKAHSDRSDQGNKTGASKFGHDTLGCPYKGGRGQGYSHRIDHTRSAVASNRAHPDWQQPLWLLLQPFADLPGTAGMRVMARPYWVRRALLLYLRSCWLLKCVGVLNGSPITRFACISCSQTIPPT